MYIWEALAIKYLHKALKFMFTSLIFLSSRSDQSPKLGDYSIGGNTPSIDLANSLTSTPQSKSRRGSLLPTQQSCEVDGDELLNENSLMTELMQVQQLSVSKGSELYHKNLIYFLSTSFPTNTAIPHLLHFLRFISNEWVVCTTQPQNFILIILSLNSWADLIG